MKLNGVGGESNLKEIFHKFLSSIVTVAEMEVNCLNKVSFTSPVDDFASVNSIPSLCYEGTAKMKLYSHLKI